MPALGLETQFWRGRRVFVTGHTGFMGGWLSLWLNRLGADVTGYALKPPTEPSLFAVAGVGGATTSLIGDVRDAGRLGDAIGAARPEFVFHLAAQPLVRAAFADPAVTFATNVQGTVNLLDAIRNEPAVRAAVIVTSDKVYANREWHWGYRETDALGGREPYGASKACAEIAVDAYRHSYFAAPTMADGARRIAIATVRAGNVIGGGDWAPDRLVPDAIRAFGAGQTLSIRHPDAVRPWQHVLEPIRGYLMLGARLAEEADELATSWNFGPADDDARNVGWVADRLTRLWGTGASWAPVNDAGPYEQRLLHVASQKARAELGWTPYWRIERTLAETVGWYKGHIAGDDMQKTSLRQIDSYLEAA